MIDANCSVHYNTILSKKLLLFLESKQLFLCFSYFECSFYAYVVMKKTLRILDGAKWDLSTRPFSGSIHSCLRSVVEKFR